MWRLWAGQNLLAPHADIHEAFDLLGRAAHLIGLLQRSGVAPRLEQARDVHTGEVVLAYSLVFEGEHQIHRLGDVVGERAPPALLLRISGEGHKCSAFCVTCSIFAAEGVDH